MAGPRHTYTIDEANDLIPEVRGVLLQLAVQQHRAGAESEDLVRSLVEHLEERSIVVRDLRMGLVDFPSERDGQPVWLCWRLADPRVAFWHGTDEGFSRRRPW